MKHLTAPSRRDLLGAALALAAVPSAPVFAQADYPSKPITLVVGYPPGGSTDLTARIVGEEMGKRLGQSMVIENLGGAGGMLGAQKVAAARPDGYTLLLGTNNEMSIRKLIAINASVDGMTDFTPIGLIGAQPMLLVASPTSGVKNLDEFLALTRRNPGKYSYGSSGIGTGLHLAGEMVKQQGGLFILHIPYRGVAPLASDLIGGRIEFAMFVMSSGLPHVKAGKMVALGSTQLARNTIAPEITPLGSHPQLKGLDISSWFALYGPARMPPALVEKLRAALRDTLRTPEVRRKLEESGATLAEPGVDLAAFMRSEQDKYARIVQFANVKE